MALIECDVAVIGAGPTGLTLANVLGNGGIKTVLVERNESTVCEPRAVSIDDESLRTMQALGLIDEVLADVALDYGAHYFTPAGVCFAKVEPQTREYGYPRRSAFSQPLLEATLRRGLARFPHVSTLFGYAMERFAEDDDGVSVHIVSPQGRPIDVRARYMVGADGGRSAVRREIGATLVGSTYRQRWLIVDLGATREPFRQTRVLCNPDRPAICLPGPHGLRRYEFMLHDDEDEDAATEPDNVRRLLAKSGPDADSPVVRRQVYTFHARVADCWQTRRVFLAGDAAHLTPPFAGQGMNSGVRDAHNLGWKLVEVLQGRLGQRLLDSYSIERAPHARELIQLAINIGRVMMPTGRWQAAAVQWGFRIASLIPPLHAYFAQMKYKPKPYYRAGFFADDDVTGLVGRMLPQPTLEFDFGKSRQLDDVVGNCFALIACGPEAQATLADVDGIDFGLGIMARLAVVPMRYNRDLAARVTMLCGRDVSDHFAPLGHIARNLLVVMRPDRYCLAAANAANEDAVTRMIADVRRLVGRARVGRDADQVAADW
jgi:3-(3-hydroxy-phenyl)propionate hydroxylase